MGVGRSLYSEGDKSAYYYSHQHLDDDSRWARSGDEIYDRKRDVVYVAEDTFGGQAVRRLDKTARQTERRGGAKAKAATKQTARDELRANTLALAAEAARTSGRLDEATDLYTKSAELLATMSLSGKKEVDRDRHVATQRRNRTWGGTRDARDNRYDDWGRGRGRTDSDSRTRGAEKRWLSVTASMPSEENDGDRNVEASKGDKLLAQVGMEKNGRLWGKLRELFQEFSNGGPTLRASQLGALLHDLGCRGQAKAYFAAFDRRGNQTWIDMEDFAVGVAVLDPGFARRSTLWQAERAAAIFRFYTGGKPRMSHATLETVIEDAHRVSGSVRPRFTPAEHAVKLNRAKGALSAAEFSRIVIANSIKGTSGLLRFAVARHLDRRP